MKRQIGNITLLGTSHIAQKSIDQITQTLSQQSFGAVGVELDLIRLKGLRSKKRTSFIGWFRAKIGVKAAIFGIIASTIQKRIGKMVSIQPGTEMLTAVTESQNRGVPVVCIDQDIRITLRKLNDVFTARFLFSVLKDSIKGIFGKSPKITHRIPLHDIPSQQTITLAMNMLKEWYPQVYDVLVHQRDIYMANQIKAMTRRWPGQPILAVVGAGHLDGIVKQLTIPIITTINEQHYHTNQLHYTHTTYGLNKDVLNINHGEVHHGQKNKLHHDGEK